MKLYLTLSRKWFNMIDSDIKKEEYREIKPYWIKRLLDHAYSEMTENDAWYRGTYPTKFPFTSIVFKNGYQSDADALICEVEFLGIEVGEPKLEWCDESQFKDKVFILKLGKIIGKE